MNQRDYHLILRDWERRLRGWVAYDRPVEIAPAIGEIEFKKSRRGDDGRLRFLSPRSKSCYIVNDPVTYEDAQGANLICICVHLARNSEYDFDVFRQFLLLVSNLNRPVTFEVHSFQTEITYRWIVDEEDSSTFMAFVHSFFPHCYHSVEDLPSVIRESCEIGVIDYGLSESAYLPMGMIPSDVNLRSVLGVMSSLQSKESMTLQISFGSVEPEQTSFLLDLHSLDLESDEGYLYSEEEINRRLVGSLVSARVRVVVQSHLRESVSFRADQFMRAFSGLYMVEGNFFIPLTNKGIQLNDHLNCVEERSSIRPGFILSVEELAGLVHYPNTVLPFDSIFGVQRTTKQVTQSFSSGETHIGLNLHQGRSTNVFISEQERLRHMHIIGATGTGKSNLLKHLIRQDMDQGKGLCLLDPHGDVIEQLLEAVPYERIKDVVVIDPSDSEFPVGINLFQAHSEAEKLLLSSDLLDLFRRYSTSWGDQMSTVLSNAIEVILDDEEPRSLLDLKLFLTDSSFRSAIIRRNTDPGLRHYWEKEFEIIKKGTVGSITSRLDGFFRSKLIRNIFIQKDGINFHEALSQSKIVLVKLSQGLIGEENSYFLGSLIISKLHQAALHRQRIDADLRTPFYLYLDEFQNFITPSMSSILSGARKYGLGLVVAHQDMEQIQEVSNSLASSVLSNPSIRICYRLGNKDARELSKTVEGFDDTDFTDLGIGQAIGRIQRASESFNLNIPLFKVEHNDKLVQSVIENSRKEWAISKAEAEQIYLKAFNTGRVSVEEQAVVESQNSSETVPDETYGQVSKKEVSQFKDQEREKQEIKEHQALQSVLKRVGEQNGFKSTKEFRLDDGMRIDLVLENESKKYAIEVAISNSVDYEIHNITKCLDVGFDKIIVCSSNANHLKRIEERFREVGVSAEVGFLTPTELINWISGQRTVRPDKQVIRGYTVEVKFEESDPSKNEQKRKAIAKVLVNRKKPKGTR